MQGLFIPQFTAFNKNDSVDYIATIEHAKWLLSNGVSGLVPFGTFGEGASISLRERMKITEQLADISHHSALIPTVISNSLGDIWEYLDFVKDIDVEAIMVIPPSYFKPIDNESLISFYKAVTSRTHHKIVAYNIPSCSMKIDVEVAKNIPIWGVKDSSGDINSAKDYLGGGVRVLLGSDILLAQGIALGASGGICGLGNFFPKHLTKVYKLASEGKNAEAGALIKATVGVFDAILKPGFDFVKAVGCLKSAAPQIIPTKLGDMRLPCPTLRSTDAELKNLVKAVEELESHSL